MQELSLFELKQKQIALCCSNCTGWLLSARVTVRVWYTNVERRIPTTESLQRARQAKKENSFENYLARVIIACVTSKGTFLCMQNRFEIH